MNDPAPILDWDRHHAAAILALRTHYAAELRRHPRARDNPPGPPRVLPRCPDCGRILRPGMNRIYASGRCRACHLATGAPLPPSTAVRPCPTCSGHMCFHSVHGRCRKCRRRGKRGKGELT